MRDKNTLSAKGWLRTMSTILWIIIPWKLQSVTVDIIMTGILVVCWGFSCVIEYDDHSKKLDNIKSDSEQFKEELHDFIWNKKSPNDVNWHGQKK